MTEYVDIAYIYGDFDLVNVLDSVKCDELALFEGVGVGTEKNKAK